MVSHVGVAVLACALAVLLPCRNSAGARSARRLLSVVSCAIVSHVIPPVFVFRVFLASASLLSCGIVCVDGKHAMESEGTLVDFEVNEWGRVTVRSQDEWDALMRDTPAGARFARIDAPASETVHVLYHDGGITVMAVGESRVVACGVDVRVRDKARVWATGSCVVSAQDEARVWAGTHVSVHAYDKARVWATGLCVVYAHESAHVWAGSAVAVYKVERFGAFRGYVEGGRVIVKRPADEMSGEQWCRAALVQVDEAGLAHLFKATGSEGVSLRGGVYQVGELVDDSENWKGDHFFGGGLHVSPSPRQALARSGFEDKSGARFFEVTCHVSELVSVADDVCKAPRLRVVREVDAWGEPL